MLKLYVTQLSGIREEEWFASHYSGLPEARKRKTDRFLRMQDKLSGMAAWFLLKYAAKEEGVHEEKIVIETDERGKPYFKESNGLFFSLSHSGQYVICAVSDEETGADVQEISEKLESLSLAERFFRRGEYDEIRSLPEKMQKRHFTRLWAVKESYVKFTGEGLSRGLDTFLIDWNGSRITDERGKTAGFFLLWEIENYIVAACTENVQEGILYHILPDRI